MDLDVEFPWNNIQSSVQVVQITTKNYRYVAHLLMRSTFLNLMNYVYPEIDSREQENDEDSLYEIPTQSFSAHCTLGFLT